METPQLSIIDASAASYLDMSTADENQVPRSEVTQDEFHMKRQEQAAGAIQRTYRGHRTRRALNGFRLDASTRWYEAVKDAQYQHLTTPQAPKQEPQEQDASTPTARTLSPAHEQWYRVIQIAKRAGQDDYSPSVSGLSSEEELENDNRLTDEDWQKRQERATEERKKKAKMMDLQYFLEMVDQKHRHGSNLRKYHNYWKSQDTNQSFFYWLDQGDGKNLNLPECSRARLDKEQVRYLSREERLNYLVKVAKDGRLIWAKNGERVWTKDELFKDSMKGIVPTSDPTPKFHYNVRPEQDNSDSSSDSEYDTDENAQGDEGERYVNEEFHRARGPAKIKHVSAAVLFNHMVRKSLQKGHKWIFVTDTSFRLYIGYKQSGSFQHSSFLHGSRITAAGLIKVKDGQLRSLSPLSGHYRPPASNFRDFVHRLRDEGCDMSHVSISKSYAVLVGIESYTRTRKRIKKAEEIIVHGKDKLFHPGKVQEEEEASRDKSQSAEKERQYLEKERQEKEKEERDRKADRGLSSRAARAFSQLRGSMVMVKEKETRNGQRLVGTGPEDGVPPPEGKR